MSLYLPCSVVYWDRRQLAVVWVTGWWFGCAEQQTEKLLVVTNKQVTTKKNIGDLMLQPPGFSIGRHVFLSGILSVLSGGTVNLLTLVTMNIIFLY